MFRVHVYIAVLLINNDFCLGFMYTLLYFSSVVIYVLGFLYALLCVYLQELTWCFCKRVCACQTQQSTLFTRLPQDRFVHAH